MKYNKTFGFVLSMFLIVMMASLVSANADITYNFNVNNARVVVYNCLNTGCTTVSNNPWFDQTTATGSLTVSYPTQLNSNGYAAYYFSSGYVPQSFNTNWYGNGAANYVINFNKLSTCYSPVDNIEVVNTAYANQPLVISYDAAISADVRSAFSDASNGVGYVPSAFVDDYYSADTQVTLEITDSNGATVYTDLIDMSLANNNPLYMDEVRNVQFTWIPAVNDTYTTRIESIVTDNQCAAGASIPQSSSKQIEVLPSIPLDMCYTLLNNPVLSNDMPSVGDSIILNYNKISNYVDSTGAVFTPIQTAITYQVFIDGILTSTSSATISANPNPNNYQTVSFPWTFTSAGNYNFVITGIGSSPLCVGKTNLQEQLNQNIFVPGVDATPPAVTVSYPVDSATYPSQVTSLDFTATDPNLNSCWYTTNGGATNISTTCTSGILESVPLTSLVGSNTWTVYAADLAGNIGMDSVTFSVAADTTPPAVNILYPLAGNQVMGAELIFFTDSELTNPQCSIDSVNWVACTSGVTNINTLTGFAALPDGLFNLYLRDTDLAGNNGTDSEAGIIKNSSIIPDTTPPVISISYPINNITYDFIVSELNFTATDPNLNSCWYTANGGVTNVSVSCASGILESVALNSTEGSNTWSVYAMDVYGNQNSASVNFFVDTTGEEDEDGKKGTSAYFKTAAGEELKELYEPIIKLNGEKKGIINLSTVSWILLIFIILAIIAILITLRKKGLI